MADISVNTACKELKIAQISQLNKIFQLLHLVHIYGHGFYELSRILMRKNVNNDLSKDSPIWVVVFRRFDCGYERYKQLTMWTYFKSQWPNKPFLSGSGSNSHPQTCVFLSDGSLFSECVWSKWDTANWQRAAPGLRSCGSSTFKMALEWVTEHWKDPFLNLISHDLS